MSLVLSMSVNRPEPPAGTGAGPLASSSPRGGFAPAGPGAFTLGDRKRRRWSALSIVALHGMLVWALLHFGVAPTLAKLAPPLLVQLLTLAPAEVPQPVASLPSPPQLRLPDPPAWVPPPEVRTVTPPEPVISLQSVVPPTVVATVDPTPVAPSPSPGPAPAASAPPTAPPQPAKPSVLPTSALRFSQAPVVEYPRASRRNKETGVVWVRAWVGATGGASSDVRVERSSGFVRLDEAAVRAVQQARFSPTVQDGRALVGWAVIPIRFTLES